ncbi:MAG: MBL fold metallo-hydrolase [Thermomicrobiales bacterium]|nr:MBL fold metallo-hydrolase [Thermomicrobiales bacterium]MCO5227665.1 MBL fold metallo-hydrolase [Thermomicrobiales bacterium]
MMIQVTDRIFVQQSQFWQTNTGIIKGPVGSLLVDPGVLPAELAAIAEFASPVAAGFNTHEHWDHLLWHSAFGVDTPRFAYMEAVIEARAIRERILRNIANSAEKWGVDASEIDPSLLFKEQPLVAGPVSIAGVACEVVPIPGHATGQAAFVLPDDKVAFVADTLSDIETPAFYGGSESIEDYLATMDQLQLIIDRVEWIVPGHGAVADRAEAQRRLDADRLYLQEIGAFVAARAGESEEDIARALSAHLDDPRGNDGLAWSMHLYNVEQLVREQGSAE